MASSSLSSSCQGACCSGWENSQVRSGQFSLIMLTYLTWHIAVTWKITCKSISLFPRRKTKLTVAIVSDIAANLLVQRSESGDVGIYDRVHHVDLMLSDVVILLSLATSQTLVITTATVKTRMKTMEKTRAMSS